MNNEEKQICTDSGCNCKGMGLDQKTCDEIVHHLRRAYCDEWLAYLQYWTAAQVVMGFMRPKMSCELMEHANEELEHARMLADRIQTLCGEIPLTPQEILEIAVYNRILKTIGDRDPVTSRIILEILEDEEEHEFEFRQIKEDIDASREALGLGKAQMK